MVGIGVIVRPQCVEVIADRVKAGAASKGVAGALGESPRKGIERDLLVIGDAETRIGVEAGLAVKVAEEEFKVAVSEAARAARD